MTITEVFKCKIVLNIQKNDFENLKNYRFITTLPQKRYNMLRDIRKKMS